MSECKVLAIANQKGCKASSGCLFCTDRSGAERTGKTTTTVNLGIGLVNNRKKVLLIDGDPQGDLTTSLGWTDGDNLSVTLATQMDKMGIVESVTKGTVNTVEGNSGNRVKRHSYPVGDNRIYGYGVPAY